MVVKGKIVDLAEVGAGPDDVGTMFEKVRAKSLDELVDCGIVRAGSDFSIKRLWYRIPSLLFEGVDDLCGLPKISAVFNTMQSPHAYLEVNVL